MNKNKKIILIITFILVILLLLVEVYLYKSNRKKDYYLNIDIESNNNVNNPINYEEVINNLREEYNNKDIKGILEIDNTDYIVPILQGSDNNYYLNHDAYGNRSGMGSIYLDFIKSR